MTRDAENPQRSHEMHHSLLNRNKDIYIKKKKYKKDDCTRKSTHAFHKNIPRIKAKFERIKILKVPQRLPRREHATQVWSDIYNQSQHWRGRRSELQDYPQLHRKSEPSLGYVRCCLKYFWAGWGYLMVMH